MRTQTGSQVASASIKAVCRAADNGGRFRNRGHRETWPFAPIRPARPLGDQVLQLSQAGASVTPIDWVRDSEFP